MEAKRKPLLLSIEDDLDWQEILQNEFGSEYLIKFAFSRKEAENTLGVLSELECPPSVCILDPTIPDSPPHWEDGKDKAQYGVGEQFAITLKSHSIPFVIFTAKPGPVRIVRAFEELGASGVFLKQEWPQNKERFLTKIRTLSSQATIAANSKVKGEQHSTQVAVNGTIGQFFLALVGFPVAVFILFTLVARFIPDYLVISVIGAGLILVFLLVVSFALFINKVTGLEFVTVITELIKRK